MFLRSTSRFERGLADNSAICAVSYTGCTITATVRDATRRGSSLVRFAPQNQTPSFDGQQACPSAALPVLFGMSAQLGPERTSRPRVVRADNSKKGSKPWACQNSYSRSQPQARWPRAATRWAIRHWVARPSVPELRLLPTAALHRVRPLGRAQTCLRARQNWSTATDLTEGHTRPRTSTAKPVQAPRLRGFCRSIHLFHHQKGQAYVQ